MEVHAPHQSILTLREALVHIAIVTVGILIALSFDGIREWSEHRSLAAEARENLMTEIRENKAELDRVIATYDTAKANYRAAYTAAQNLVASQPLGTNSITMGFQIAELSAGAYATAEVTGAFAHMEYRDVRSFASVYDLQRKYDAMQDQSLTHMMDASAPLIANGDPSNARISEIQDWPVRIQHALAALTIQQQLAEGLTKAYGEVLAGQPN